MFNHARKRLHLESLEDRRVLAIIVDTLVDEMDGSITDGDVSLRDAVEAASDNELIIVDTAGTLSLDLGTLVIRKPLTIIGPGADSLSVEAPHTAISVSDGDDDSVISVSLSGMTIGNSWTGISTREYLSLTDVHISGNSLVGIRVSTSQGTIDATRVVIADNDNGVVVEDSVRESTYRFLDSEFLNNASTGFRMGNEAFEVGGSLQLNRVQIVDSDIDIGNRNSGRINSFYMHESSASNSQMFMKVADLLVSDSTFFASPFSTRRTTSFDPISRVVLRSHFDGNNQPMNGLSAGGFLVRDSIFERFDGVAFTGGGGVVSGSIFRENSIAISASSNFTLEYSEIVDNSMMRSGGYSDGSGRTRFSPMEYDGGFSGQLIIRSSNFSNNETVVGAAAIVTRAGTHLLVSDTDFEGNVSSGDPSRIAGVLCIEQNPGRVTIDDVSFENNEVDGSGGGLVVFNPGEMT
ncbi:MAG: hypothetical protein AAF497_02780, partial [Planctomycetota bacterium]